MRPLGSEDLRSRARRNTASSPRLPPTSCRAHTPTSPPHDNPGSLNNALSSSYPHEGLALSYHSSGLPSFC